MCNIFQINKAIDNLKLREWIEKAQKNVENGIFWTVYRRNNRLG